MTNTNAGRGLAATERQGLADALASVGPDAPTLCEGWNAADLAAHVVIRDRRPDLAVGMVVPFLSDRLEDGMQAYAAKPWSELVDLVRHAPPWHPTRIRAVDEVVNLAEMVIHHEDVLRGDLATGQGSSTGQPGPRREPSPALNRAVWVMLRRTARLMWRRCPVNVSLVAPGRGRIAVHPASSEETTVTVTGDPIELLLFSYGRKSAAAVTLDGPAGAVTDVRRAKLGLP